jgi:hypothetical protein
MELAVHVERAHFFDPQTGEVIAHGAHSARPAVPAAS